MGAGVDKMESKALSDGKLSNAKKRRIEHEQNKVSKEIFARSTLRGPPIRIPHHRSASGRCTAQHQSARTHGTAENLSPVLNKSSKKFEHR
jgi:hypothetical protein